MVQGSGGTDDCKGMSGHPDQSKPEPHLAVPSLIVEDEIVLCGQSRSHVVPHRQVRQQRVDKDQPRPVLSDLRDFDVELYPARDRDFDMADLGSRIWHRLVIFFADVESNEQTRDHVVGSHGGGRFEDELVDFVGI